VGDRHVRLGERRRPLGCVAGRTRRGEREHTVNIWTVVGVLLCIVLVVWLVNAL
jgi:hypothetical protein